ncbi:uncharacterized protein BKA78DRAFT_175946 [Phyllosticta capitalensis]|uniref:uncharacterized protein n=1 Tax=Phyllosticta capitalensis TaxID=121624 RepID=UPI00312FEF2A
MAASTTAANTAVGRLGGLDWTRVCRDRPTETEALFVIHHETRWPFVVGSPAAPNAEDWEMRMWLVRSHPDTIAQAPDSVPGSLFLRRWFHKPSPERSHHDIPDPVTMLLFAVVQKKRRLRQLLTCRKCVGRLPGGIDGTLPSSGQDSYLFGWSCTPTRRGPLKKRARRT